MFKETFSSGEEFLRYWLLQLWVMPQENLESVFDRYWGEKASADGVGGVRYEKRDATIEFVRAFRTNFDRIEVYSKQYHETDDGWVVCVIEVVFDLDGKDAISLPGMIRAQVNKETWQLEESINYIDFLPLLEKMDVLPQGALMKALSGSGFVGQTTE